MPAPKLEITVRNAHQQIDRLEKYRSESGSIEAKYQHFIAEMIMLRLFSIFEDSVAEIAYKLVSGATYTNGTFPALAVSAGAMSGARGLFLSYGRTIPVQNLKWTKSKYIRESVQHVISTSDPFIISAQRNGNIIDEMRKMRNVLAHNTTSAKADFKTVVRLTYGANVNITPGAFLSSIKRTSRCNLDRYLSSTKAVLMDMASGV
ncbi:hypothetical protein [Pseudidiomarina donghaiensis]|uniref:RiboL-PSP-HEPN domain-containing protein n=1 Tax=Pseudidiomarina donghaiensis TaxID=519452 RepID=A0A432XJL6_9GAMM|nr:hypothetical protein [Pseudidiomarina donghaiensis]RUO48964.1 hypothetical protein CWE24_00135 [Pseudidiomarina donghaiensis]SFV20323.1 hypothetical protein SAMN04488139_0159 [Pseudidiomarina donghaiensis]